jgi:tripartite-type tricarboxylate transporter receptor subunit TctC
MKYKLGTSIHMEKSNSAAHRPSRRVALWLLPFLVIGWSAAGAQQVPSTQPVRIITAFSPGSGPDAMLRMIGEKLEKIWARPVIIDNRPGGSGFIAIGAATGKPTDGSTLLHADSLSFTALPYLYKRLPYSPQDFVPISPVHRSFFFITVAADSPYKSMADLLAAAAKPNQVTYGSWQVGSVAHLGGAMLEAASSTKMQHVPFRDTTQMLSAVAAKEVHWGFGTLGSAGPLQRAGKLKYLAYAAPARDPLQPNVPTVSEAGGPPGFAVSGWVLLLGPKGIPEPLVAKISADLGDVMASADIRSKMVEFGYTPTAMSPAETVKLMQIDAANFSATAKRSAISLD